MRTLLGYVFFRDGQLLGRFAGHLRRRVTSTSYPFDSMRSLPLVLLGLLLSLPAAAQAFPEPPVTPFRFTPVAAGAPLLGTSGFDVPALQEPPSSPTPVIDQMAAGVGGGVLGAGLLSLALLPVVSGPGDDGWGVLAAVGIGTLVGYPAGATAGVYRVSNRKGQSGSLLSTVGGAVLGSIAGTAFAGSTRGLSYVVLVPAGATAGFNLTRRPTAPVPVSPAPVQSDPESPSALLR